MPDRIRSGAAAILGVALLTVGAPAVSASPDDETDLTVVDTTHVEPEECDDFRVDEQNAILLNGAPLTDEDIALLAEDALPGYDDQARLVQDVLRMFADAQSRSIGDVCLDADLSGQPDSAKLHGHFEVCGAVGEGVSRRVPISVADVAIVPSQVTRENHDLAEPAAALGTDACFRMELDDGLFHTEFTTELCVTAAAWTEPVEDNVYYRAALGYLDVVFELEPRDPEQPIVDPDGLLAEAGGSVLKLQALAWQDWDWGETGLRLTVLGPADCPDATPLPPEYFPSPEPAGYGATTGGTPIPRSRPSQSPTPSPSPSPSSSATPSPSPSITPTATPSPTASSPSPSVIAAIAASATVEPGSPWVLPLFLFCVLAFLGGAGFLGWRYRARRTPPSGQPPAATAPPTDSRGA